MTSAQLSTYFVGTLEHFDLRRDVEKAWGEEFDLKTYHDKILSFGSPPVQIVRALLLDEAITMDPIQESSRNVAFDPVIQKIEGWTVHVDPQMLWGKHQQVGAEALKMLANHLQRIAILMPEERLAQMRKLEIWIEHHHPTLGSMQYHPSIDWLRPHGHDLRLAKKVHIPRAAALLARHHMLKHPAVVLHELAHAYHDQFLSFDNPGIIKIYEKAKAAGIYENSLLFNGKTVRHYGLNDHKEYFAEGTEAYFYRNDFYPFCRAELKEHDPALHALLVDIWGPLK